MQQLSAPVSGDGQQAVGHEIEQGHSIQLPDEDHTNHVDGHESHCNPQCNSVTAILLAVADRDGGRGRSNCRFNHLKICCLEQLYMPPKILTL